MLTNDEEAAAVTTTEMASESSRLVIVHALDLDLNATNNRKKTWKMGVATASLLLIFGGTFRYSHLLSSGRQS